MAKNTKYFDSGDYQVNFRWDVFLDLPYALCKIKLNLFRWTFRRERVDRAYQASSWEVPHRKARSNNT